MIQSIEELRGVPRLSRVLIHDEAAANASECAPLTSVQV